MNRTFHPRIGLYLEYQRVGNMSLAMRGGLDNSDCPSGQRSVKASNHVGIRSTPNILCQEPGNQCNTETRLDHPQNRTICAPMPGNP